MAGKKISFPARKSDKDFAKLWLGSVGIVLLFALVSEGFEMWSLPIILIFFLGGLRYFNKTVWGIADQVDDCGEYLRVSKGSKTDEITISSICEVCLAYPNHKHLITIKLSKSCLFGRSVTFRSHKGFPVFRAPEAFFDLKHRVDSAKNRRGQAC